jgi:hypothetical protein
MCRPVNMTTIRMTMNVNTNRATGQRQYMSYFDRLYLAQVGWSTMENSQMPKREEEMKRGVSTPGRLQNLPTLRRRGRLRR